MNHAKLLFTAILSGNNGAACQLVVAGADPNFILREGAAPIHVAAGLDSVTEDVIRLLLRHGADPNLRSSEGETPLHVSAAYGRCEVLKLFLQSGADPDILNQEGQSAADLARQSGCELCMLTLRECVEAEAEVRDDDRTAFSLEPYEPRLFPPLGSFQLSPEKSPEVTPRDRVDGSDTRSYTLNSDDVTCGSQETTASTLNSTASFHTCPSDNDTGEQRQTHTQTINSQSNSTHPTEPSTVMKSPSSVPPVSYRTWTGSSHKETSEHAQSRDRTSYDAATRSEGCRRQTSRTQLPGTKFDTSGIELSDSSTLDYSPGRSLNAGGGGKRLSATRAYSNPNSPCSSQPALGNNHPVLNVKRTFKEKRDELFDDTVSSCSSAAFVPSEFDYSDLSLHMDPPTVQHDKCATRNPGNPAYRQSPQKTPQVKDIEHDEVVRHDTGPISSPYRQSPQKISLVDSKDNKHNEHVGCHTGPSRDPHRQSPQKTSVGKENREGKNDKVIQRYTGPYGQSPQKTAQIDVPSHRGADGVRTLGGRDLWYGQMHHYDKVLSTTTDVCVDAENLPRTSSRNEPAICADLLDNLSLSTIAESLPDEGRTNNNRHDFGRVPTLLPEGFTQKFSGKCSTQYQHQPMEDKGSVPLYGPCQRLVPNSGDVNKEGVALRGPYQHLLANSGDGSNSSHARHWSLGSNSSRGSRNSSTSSIGPIHFLYTDDEDGYSLIESWYPSQDEDLKPVSPEPHPVSPLTLPVQIQPIKTTATQPKYTQPIKNPVTQPKYTQPIKTPATQPKYTQPIKTTATQPEYTQPIKTPVTQPKYTQPIKTPVTQPKYTQPIKTPITQPMYQESLDLSDDTIIYDYQDTRPRKSKTKRAWSVDAENAGVHPVADDVTKLTDAGLRQALIAVGVTPGPINDDTRALYKQKLAKLQQTPAVTRLPTGSAYLPEVGRLLAGDLDTSLLQTLEDDMVKPFSDLDPARKWREGTRKFSFNYLLLDPRITDNLPARVKTIGEVAAFRDFVTAIFYVGKGKRARPYAHFKEAIQHKAGATHKPPGPKVQRILDVWCEGHGVISLHVFQNVIPVEAYTREAAMIDAIGRPKLTNIKGGEYYGVAAWWPAAQRRALGARLLHKSYRIFLSEGERHIRPADIQGS